jgi:hypothetical protein
LCCGCIKFSSVVQLISKWYQGIFFHIIVKCLYIIYDSNKEDGEKTSKMNWIFQGRIINLNGKMDNLDR